MATIPDLVKPGQRTEVQLGFKQVKLLAGIEFAARFSEVGGYGGCNPATSSSATGSPSSSSRGGNRRGRGARERPCAGVEGRTPVPDCGKPPARVVIPACIGCGAMRRDESCPEGCAERRTELVNGADYDKLAAVAAAYHDRLGELRAVAGELAQAEPADGGWKAAYEALQRSARSALRRSATPAPGGRDDPFAPVPTAVVWRCPDCGAVDAPQPCIGVCIWRPAEWIDAACYERERSRAAADRQAGQCLAGLLGRLAYTTPRAGQWERSLRALQAQARSACR